MPIHKGKLCAVGYSGPTFYQQDCFGNATDNARGHLAETISATIKTITLDISDGTRGIFSRDVFVQGSETASETVLQGSEVESQWMDSGGQRGAPNGCYAMVCIDPSKPIDSFVEQIEEKLPAKTVEAVRANAQSAFEELEKAETKTSPLTLQPTTEVEEKSAPTPDKVTETTQDPVSTTTKTPAQAPSEASEPVQPEDNHPSDAQTDQQPTEVNAKSDSDTNRPL